MPKGTGKGVCDDEGEVGRAKRLQRHQLFIYADRFSKSSTSGDKNETLKTC